MKNTCEMCWESQCLCGYAYRKMHIKNFIKLIFNMIKYKIKYEIRE